MAPGVGTASASESAIREYVAGFIAGMANVLSGYPFDTVKVRMQADRGQYRGPMHCLASIVRKEGPATLFRGVALPLLGGAVETGVNYAVFSRTLHALQAASAAAAAEAVPECERATADVGAAEHAPPSLADTAVAAAVAGAALSLVLGPTELVKCRMQVGGDRYRSAGHCVASTVRSEGYAGLFRGLNATLAREVPGNVVFFATYGWVKRVLPDAPRSSDATGWGAAAGEAANSIVAGGLSGCVMWLLVLPVDVAKTRIQTATPGSTYDIGVINNLARLHAEGGVAKLWTGLSPVLMRAFPANACQWLAWEAAIHWASARPAG